jgi:Delta3-Delta2-enoyl-CoA isomerase
VTPDAFFFTPFVQWGLSCEACSSLTFSRIMGRQKASALLLAGSRMTAQELESAGLVTKILPKEGFLEQVMEVARGMVKLPKESLVTNKELMMRQWREDLLEVNRVEMELLRSQARGRESKEAIASFAKAQEEKKKNNKKRRAKMAKL